MQFMTVGVGLGHINEGVLATFFLFAAFILTESEGNDFAIAA